MRWAAVVCLSGFLFAVEPAKVLFDRAARALSAGDYRAAEQGFRAVLKQEPGNVGALGNLGVIYARTNRSDEAISAYQRALKLIPDDQPILLNLGLVHLKQDAHARALPYFQRVVALNPGHRQARQLLALCRIYTGAVDAAIRDLEALRTEAPRDEQVLFLLGFAYLKNKDAERSKTVFAEMFEAAGPVRAQFLYGKACYEDALFDRAEESYLSVLRLDPHFPGMHVELGKLYISQRRTDDAIRELGSALKNNPDDKDANYFLGGLLVQATRYEEAIPYLERAKKLVPDSWATYFYLGKAKLRLQQPADAAALLQRAVALNPYEASAYYHLGLALRACGRQDESRAALQKVRELRANALESATLKDDGVAGTR